MSAKHTPGPWEVHINAAGEVWVHEVDLSRGQMVICDIPGDMETIEGEQLCNADLIAAAPDLLAALKAILTAEWMVTHDWGGDRDSVLVLAEAAIKKAEGNP